MGYPIGGVSKLLFVCCLFGVGSLGYVKRDVESFFTRETCMDELGCFNAGPPFYNFLERPLSFVPDDRRDINTRFSLYTRDHPQVASNFSNLDRSIENLPRTKFNPHVPTKFIVPGYISYLAPHWKMPLKEALLFEKPCNVFYVDWSAEDGPIYEQAVANTRVVGAEIALFIQKLEQKTGIKPESIHIIGHSLGAHIAGYVGKRVKNLARITAMDPAGPYFTNVDPVVRLDRSDALFVDAIHTNAAPNRFKGFGLAESIAHFDFYPNGGHIQPGCTEMGEAVWKFLQHPVVSDGLHDLGCNHGRAADLFISSILNSHECELWGTSCKTFEDFNKGECGHCSSASAEGSKPICVPMGFHSEHYAEFINPGKSIDFFLNTTDHEPFCNEK